MVDPSVENIGNRADAVVSTLQCELQQQAIVGSVLAQYTGFCGSSDAKRLQIAQRPITSELRLRLYFECLCFCAFCASLLSGEYITERKWFSRRPNQQLIGLFDGALATALMVACARLGVSELRDLTLVAVEPKPTFGYGAMLDPLNRLEEYRGAFAEQRGSELERFGKWIGKTLDPPHYPLLEMIGCPYATLLLQLTNQVMATVFSRSA